MNSLSFDVSKWHPEHQQYYVNKYIYDDINGDTFGCRVSCAKLRDFVLVTDDIYVIVINDIRKSLPECNRIWLQRDGKDELYFDISISIIEFQKLKRENENASMTSTITISDNVIYVSDIDCDDDNYHNHQYQFSIHNYDEYAFGLALRNIHGFYLTVDEIKLLRTFSINSSDNVL